jgi:hypothetical protein
LHVALGQELHEGDDFRSSGGKGDGGGAGTGDGEAVEFVDEEFRGVGDEAVGGEQGGQIVQQGHGWRIA